MTRTEQEIQLLMGQKIKKLSPLHGGCISEVSLIEWENQELSVVKKRPSRGIKNTLILEAKMLQYLANQSKAPIPEVLHADQNYLILSYIPNDGKFGLSSESHAAEIIGELHNITSNSFGLPFDAVLAGILLPEKSQSSWVSFFREHRLLYFANIASKSGAISLETKDRIHNLAEQLENLLTEPSKPSLIHGDIWSGNLLWLNGQLVGLIDPAIYYAHPEMELAFIRLFNTFGSDFFSAYESNSGPLDRDFYTLRSDLYNLIPLLVHAILFGGSYTASINQSLRKHGF